MRRLHKNLTVQVLVAISLGIVLGVVAPDVGRKMKPVGDTFVNLVKMVIAPVVFLTIVLGIANMRDLKRVGRVGGKALLYFEIVTTFALAIGLIVVNILKPGRGLVVSALAKSDVSTYVTAGKSMTFADFVTHIVPSSVVDAFAKGDMLQVVFVAVLFGIALAFVGEDGRAVMHLFEALSRVFFRIRRHRDDGGTDRRFRRNGVHHRSVRPVSAHSVGPLDARRLHDDGAVHLHRAE
jgi:aerobic C4-dicarboxylate transport protein